MVGEARVSAGCQVQRSRLSGPAAALTQVWISSPGSPWTSPERRSVTWPERRGVRQAWQMPMPSVLPIPPPRAVRRPALDVGPRCRGNYHRGVPGPSPASDSPENDLRAAEDAPAAADDSGTAEGTEERTEEGTEGIVASGRPRRRTWWVFALVAAALAPKKS